MEGPERVVCCSLCLCMAVAVFSSVALVYLTALVYMPAKREINSGLSDVPVMCTTVQRLETDDCDWYSCGEWCLSKSSHCVKLWAQVRKNGTDVAFRGCTDVRDITCMVLDNDFVEKRSCSHDSDCESLSVRFFSKCRRDCGDSARPFRCDDKSKTCVSRRQHRNCKDDGACTELDSLFLCDNGLCQNITSAYDCTFGKTDPPLDCRDKRNCITIEGLFNCKNGQCAKLQWPWHCERRCPPASTSRRHNVLLLSGDRMLSANCEVARETNTLQNEVLWTGGPETEDVLLVASCTDVDLDEGSGAIAAGDCVNGTLLPRSLLPPRGEANHTVIHDLFGRYGRLFPLDSGGDMTKIPFDSDITIYNRTKLLINTEACVNTLQYECTEFYLDHRRDGRNYSAHDRFPCYYTPKHGNFVTTRFNLSTTRYVFYLAFSIPASLWVLSCSCLFGCSKMLRVEENGQMRIRCRKRLSSSEGPITIPMKPRRSASVRRKRGGSKMA